MKSSTTWPFFGQVAVEKPAQSVGFPTRGAIGQDEEQLIVAGYRFQAEIAAIDLKLGRTGIGFIDQFAKHIGNQQRCCPADEAPSVAVMRQSGFERKVVQPGKSPVRVGAW